MEEQKHVHIALVGSPRVGKTAFMIRYLDYRFQEHYDPTTTYNSMHKNSFVEDEYVRIHIIDLSGHTYASSNAYKCVFTKAQCIMIMYDVGNRESFDDVANWLKTINLFCHQSPLLVMVANKIDVNPRVISQDSGLAYARNMAIPYVELSVKDDAFSVQHLVKTWAECVLAQDNKPPKYWKKKTRNCCGSKQCIII